MIRKILAAVLRFVHENGYLLQLADYLERPVFDVTPEGEPHGEDSPQ